MHIGQVLHHWAMVQSSIHLACVNMFVQVHIYTRVHVESRGHWCLLYAYMFVQMHIYTCVHIEASGH